MCHSQEGKEALRPPKTIRTMHIVSLRLLENGKARHEPDDPRLQRRQANSAVGSHGRTRPTMFGHGAFGRGKPQPRRGLATLAECNLWRGRHNLGASRASMRARPRAGGFGQPWPRDVRRVIEILPCRGFLIQSF